MSKTPQPKNVQSARIAHIRAVFGAVVDLLGVMNRPQRDAGMIAEAGISLDRALFPLIVGIGRDGPIGVVDLAERVGRDYTTVSRQVAKLEKLGLVERRTGQRDRRVREAVVSRAGRRMTDSIDRARDRVLLSLFADWRPKDIATLAPLLRRLADNALQPMPRGKRS
jgi:DNA-binding MarR family transcriptional regulator